jgi:Glycosyltransferase WbsX
MTCMESNPDLMNTDDSTTEVAMETAGQRIVSIYAWNEWSEGGYLEPEERTGNDYLESIKDVFPPKQP